MRLSKEIEDRIYGWAWMVLNPNLDNTILQPDAIPIIWMHQNGPRPNVSYITLHIIESGQKGLPYISENKAQFDNHGVLVPGTDIQNIERDKRLNVSIQGYGSKGGEYLEALRDSLDLESVMEYFDCNGLSALTPTPIKDISIVIDSQAESRDVFEVPFLTGIVIPEQVGYISNVDYSGTLKFLKSHEIEEEIQI